MRPNEDNIILWRELEGKTEFKHGFNDEIEYWGDCPKCKEESCGDEPGCPIPDPFPGTDADIAERIRVWAESNENDDYFTELDKIHWVNSKWADIDFQTWLVYHCTPSDKIKSFISLFKE